MNLDLCLLKQFYVDYIDAVVIEKEKKFSDQ